MMKRKNLYALFSCLFLSGCGMIDYHPYDVRISGETEVNAHNMERIEANCQGKTTIRFVTMGDSQRWYDETEDFVKAINQRNDIDFVIHGGDMSDFGLTKEFLWQRDIMNGLHVPYVALIGNHDCLGTGAETYKAVFGPTNFSFIAGDGSERRIPGRLALPHQYHSCGNSSPARTERGYYPIGRTIYGSLLQAI